MDRESLLNLPPVQKAATILTSEGFSVDEVADAWAHHIALVRKWNRVAGFVSRGEVDRLAFHLTDSLSLARVVKDGGGDWLDIGPGGGFPSIPVKILVPSVELTVVERSEKKAGVLGGMLSKLHITEVELVVGPFPEKGPRLTPAVVTARAVEKPETVFEGIAPLVNDGAVFLCQRDPSWWQERMFHVEQVQDEWSKQGIRRGELYRVTRVTQ